MSKIALFQDYLAQMGGAERVTEALHQTLPEADLYTTFAIPEKLSPYLREAHPIKLHGCSSCLRNRSYIGTISCYTHSR